MFMKSAEKIKNVLVSQPQPVNIEKSPYKNLVEKYHVNLHFLKFFDVVGIETKEFRKQKVHIQDYTSVILNSKNSIEHFFRIAKEMREEIPDSMKYFCSSEAVALYLQNYIQYRKRKVFFAKQHFAELIDIIQKHKEDRFLFPCSEETQTDHIKMLDKSKLKYTRASMYRSVAKDLKKIDLDQYDMVVLFSPQGVKALLQNYPNFDSEKTLVSAFGTSTHAALSEAGIKLTVAAPTKVAPSMAMAIEDFILGKEPEPVITMKPSSLKKASTKKNATTKKVKSVIANKAKYDQMMEEKRAALAAKRKKKQENNSMPKEGEA